MERHGSSAPARMPPADPPVDSPEPDANANADADADAAEIDAGQPPSFISALRELASPVNQDVLNLAATLGRRSADGNHDSSDDDSDDDNDNDYNNDNDNDYNNDNDSDIGLAITITQGPATRPQVLHNAQQQEYDDLRRVQEHDQLWLHRVMSRLSRLSDNTTTTAAYGDRVPNQNSLYDWSPANEAARDDADNDDVEDDPNNSNNNNSNSNNDLLEHILAELRREQPNTPSEILRVLGQSQLDSDRARILSLANRLQNPTPGAGSAGGAGESLRSTAILQSVRRHPRFSARTREYLQRHQTDRHQAAAAASRNSQQGDEAARSPTMQRLSEGRFSLDRERRDMLSRADSYRRGYLDRTSTHATPPAPTVSSVLEHTVKYLSRIRHSNSIDDSLNCALDAGFLSKDYFSPDTDFITDTSVIPQPAETSWLTPGAVLSGSPPLPAPPTPCTGYAFSTSSGSAPPTTLPALPPPSRPWISNPYATTRSPSQRLAESQQPSKHQDPWPVKVTIHAVDWEKMSLSATMKAYNVPSPPHTHQSILGTSSLVSQTPSNPSSMRTSSVTTFLEGEILDFNTHTLLTESFKSTPANDATYWRKLPPFASMSDEEMVRALTSRRWFEEVLGREWILMRWKERCFVKSLNKCSANPDFQAPQSTTTSTSLGGRAWPLSQYTHPPPSTSSSSSTSTSTPQPRMPASPYRIVRNSQTGRAEVEISQSLLANDLSEEMSGARSNNDAEHATFDDSGCGLTISGFYYVCLRRSDGALEGLYYDPQTSLYQCLRLESLKGGVRGAWAFR
ncbi:hypothetical protein LEMA_P017260.1 [Plenodomus lingam JN3]|uniref:Vacuolar import and degradation protein-domain-containing protein n=1 Tax=Leptosphaeria maculans (strain JN3 / isolate v23.1.3 / race Av1-4-5-6-7-8) TaxID=985895 RepID=E5AAA5_LEPMJ|nr:hypothetical protein LEMA_P017260.1 [Plenodomus lingam JN3]CBY00596.1 hypothetical protein LEMA_P017260.1 [Plenodomus lingam JN3]